MQKNKRGQFYLITALVIISLIVGYATISNYTQKKEHTRTYDLAEELEIESAEVLDYGVYQDIDTTQMESLLTGFIELYSEEIGKLDELYFVFGDKDEIIFVAYQQLQDALTAGVGLDGVFGTPIPIDPNTASSTIVSGANIKKVSVEISYPDGTQDEYDFKLNPGNNFYFILSDVVGEERYTETTGDIGTTTTLGDIGDKCGGDDDCNSGHCYKGKKCVECLEDNHCPSGYECDNKECEPEDD